jgi:hypothetical protein
VTRCEGCGDRDRQQRVWLLNELGNLACLLRLALERPAPGKLEKVEKRIVDLRDRLRWD